MADDGLASTDVKVGRGGASVHKSVAKVKKTRKVVGLRGLFSVSLDSVRAVQLAIYSA
jgi:hypothetical protein